MELGKGKGKGKGKAKAEPPKTQQPPQQQKGAEVKRSGRGGSSESEAMPEWKLKCLCTDSGVPPFLTGALNMACGF